MINFTEEEIEFLEENGINPKKLKTRWEWVDKKKALAFYRDVIYSYYNRVPTKDEIDKIGYRGLRYALKRIGKTPTDLIRELGLKNYDWREIYSHNMDLPKFTVPPEKFPIGIITKDDKLINLNIDYSRGKYELVSQKYVKDDR